MEYHCEMKLNLGCWTRKIPGFVNIDQIELPNVDLVANVNDLSMFENESIELIYASHVIAYFDSSEIIQVLEEWKRVLKRDGILRLSTPDFSALIRIYETTQDLKDIIGPIFGKMRFENAAIYHKVIYDEMSLRSLLEKTGFTRIEHWDWRNTEHAKYDDHSQAYFPHMKKDTGIQVSINLEARKI